MQLSYRKYPLGAARASSQAVHYGNKAEIDWAYSSRVLSNDVSPYSRSASLSPESSK